MVMPVTAVITAEIGHIECQYGECDRGPSSAATGDALTHNTIIFAPKITLGRDSREIRMKKGRILFFLGVIEPYSST